MPEKVIKRDGSKENFIPEKICVSCIKAGAPVETAREIADDMEKLEGDIKTEKLRTKVLNRLEEENKEWKENWLTFDRAVKKRR